jgi:hypothetical protein
MSQSNAIVSDAIAKTGIPVEQYFLWCVRKLGLANGQSVVQRLQNEFKNWENIENDIPGILDLSFDVVSGREHPESVGQQAA